MKASSLQELISKHRKNLDPDHNDLRNFDFNNAHNIYRILLKKDPQYRLERHITVIPDGLLYGLPFATLRTKEGGTLQDRSWLIDSASVSTSPSLQIFHLQRSAPRENQLVSSSFLGIGNPVFSGSDKSYSVSSRSLFQSRFLNDYQGQSIADQTILRKLEALPETEDELRKMGRYLGASNLRLLLGREATEENIKKLDYSPYDIIAFATHGIMAGEIGGSDQAGLALTPPNQATKNDDGFLSVEEIRDLNINADLVVLSACNTSSSSGEVSGEGFTGLVRSFFLSGVRSVLATHWAVASEPTVDLTVGFSKHFKNNLGNSKAKALQASMKDLKKSPEFSHPFFWAPFELVGE